jgi:hypothetical protein
LRFLLAALQLALLGGCVSAGPSGGLQAQWQSSQSWGERLGSAAVAAARDPGTWAPLAGAAVLSIGSLDEELSDWAADEQPLFGNQASDRSDLLRDLSIYSALVTAAVVPAPEFGDRVQNVLLTAGVLLADGAVTEALKAAARRERPNGRGDLSFPSGHASEAAAGSVLALRNLSHSALSPGARRAAQTGFVGVAAAAGWARVEARKHFPTDVLVGYAIGNFLGNFAHELLFPESARAGSLTLAPLQDGAALTVTLPLR